LRTPLIAGQLGRPIPRELKRHGYSGNTLANDGLDTRAVQLDPGNKNIQHTVRYPELSASKFKDFWQD
jgi:type 1 fimbriae regulatory protein FimB/type 1 fimbriae regulatory protein FimE